MPSIKPDMDRLRGMNGTAFDTAYMQHMVQDHQKDVAEFQKQAQSGVENLRNEVFACVAAASPDGSVGSTQRIVGATGIGLVDKPDPATASRL